MKIIGADERLAEPRGVKALIVGPTGRAGRYVQVGRLGDRA